MSVCMSKFYNKSLGMMLKVDRSLECYVEEPGIVQNVKGNLLVQSLLLVLNICCAANLSS